MKVKIGRTKDFGVNPLYANCATGSKLGNSKYKYGSITIMCSGIPLSKTHINKDILRAALLSDPTFMKEALGIEVRDIYAGIKDDLPEVDPLDAMEYEELKEHARSLGVEFKGNLSRAKLTALIKEA